ITCLANRTDDVDRFRVLALGLARFLHWNDLVKTVVKRRADEVVHARIDNREFFLAGPLDVTNPSKQDSSVAHEQAARLQQNPQFQFAQWRQDCIDISLDRQLIRALLFSRALVRQSYGFVLRRARARIPPILAAAQERRFVNDPDSSTDAEELDLVFRF